MYIITYNTKMYVKKERVNFITVLGKKAEYQNTPVTIIIDGEMLDVRFHVIDSGYGKRSREYQIDRAELDSCEYSIELHCIRIYGNIKIQEYDSSDKKGENVLRAIERKQDMYLYTETLEEEKIVENIRRWAGTAWTEMQ